jgi:hypothetical protein
MATTLTALSIAESPAEPLNGSQALDESGRKQ